MLRSESAASNFLEPRQIVHVRRTVQGHQQRMVSGCPTEMFFRARKQSHKRVDHHVADAVNPGGVMPSRSKFWSPSGEGVNSKSEIWSVRMRLISSGMSSVSGTQACFDVSHGDARLRTHETRGDSRIHVAIDENEVGLALQQDGSIAIMTARGLLGMSPEPTSRLTVGQRHFELLKKTSDMAGS